MPGTAKETTNMNDKKLLKEVRKYEGRSVEDFLYSDIGEFIGLDIINVNGKQIGCGEEYEPDYRTIKYIQIRNVMGYIITDIEVKA